MWLAHLLTISRIPLAGIFWLVADRPGWALLVLFVGAATDVVDGHIARFAKRWRAERGRPAPSALGEWLDPLCDKTFVLSVLGAVWFFHEPAPALLLAIASREIILVPIAAVYRFTPWLRSRLRYRFRAGVFGKAATVCQFAAITALLFGHPALGSLSVLASVVGVLAALDYIRRGVRLAGRGPAVGRHPLTRSPRVD